MAGQAVVTLEHGEGAVDLIGVGHGEVGVAAAAAGGGVVGRDHGLGPVVDIAVGVGAHRRAALSAVTDCAAELGWEVDHIGVRGEDRVAVDPLHARRHAHVAADAPVGGTELGDNDLAELDAELLGLLGWNLGAV